MITYNGLTKVNTLEKKFPNVDWYAILLTCGEDGLDQYSEYYETTKAREKQ